MAEFFHIPESNDSSTEPKLQLPTSTIDENELLDFSSIDNLNINGLENTSSNLNAKNSSYAGRGHHSQHLSTSVNSVRKVPSSLSSSVNNSYISQSLSSSIPIKQSLAKALPTLSESYSSENKVHKVSIGRRKSVVKRENNEEDEDGIERKRRDNMNDKIQELLLYIPREYFHDSKDKSSGTKDGKPNKGQILTKGLEYIQDLQNKIDENNRKEVELILKLKNLSIKKSEPLGDINVNNTSAEIVLGEIGVGPLAGLVSASDTPTESQKSPNNNFEYGGYDQYGD